MASAQKDSSYKVVKLIDSVNKLICYRKIPIITKILTIDIMVVVVPLIPRFVLAPYVPHPEVHAPARGNALHVEADCGYRGHSLMEFDLVEQRRLACEMYDFLSY